MRIRKNAKLSPLLFSSSSSSQGGSVPVETFQTHVCQLNQSPWDVIPFDSDSIQFEAEDDSFTAGNNGSAGDSFGAVESVASPEEKPKIEDMVGDDNHHDNQHGRKVSAADNKGLARNSCCKGLDGKGWPCKSGAKQGQSFCDHHLSLLRSYNNNGNGNGGGGCNKKAPATAAARRARPRAAVKKTSSSSSNPYEFYYYSGFGPLWGKRRGDRNGEGSRNGIGGVTENSAMVESDNVVIADNVAGDDNIQNDNDVVPSPLEIDNEGFDYVEDDDEEEDADDDDNGKKRMRKPVKARSLKSLM